MVIFHSYVSLPEGNPKCHTSNGYDIHKSFSLGDMSNYTPSYHHIAHQIPLHLFLKWANGWLYIYICFYFYPHSIPMKPLLNPIKPPFIIIYRYLMCHFVWEVSNCVRPMQIIVYRFHLNHMVSTKTMIRMKPVHYDLNVLF